MNGHGYGESASIIGEEAAAEPMTTSWGVVDPEWNAKSEVDILDKPPGGSQVSRKKMEAAPACVVNKEVDAELNEA